jgi:hypothetical protein
MLSTLPKLADRTFVLGFFLPTLLFTIAALVLFSHVGNAGEWLKSLTAKDLTTGAYLLLAVWVGGLLLLMLNHYWYQLLEGYKLPKPLRCWLRQKKQERLRKLLDEIKKLYDRYQSERERFPPKLLDRYMDLRDERATWLPPNESLVLATDFGNAIRAFESYPNEIYGVDGVTLWTHLSMVMPKEVTEGIDQSRTNVDFLINCMFFSLVFAALAVVRCLYTGPWTHIREFGYFLGKIQYSWLFWTGVALIAAWIFYRWAVNRVPEWGAAVDAAFDCYLPKVAEQLGYELPLTADEQQTFWTTLSQQIIYRRDPDNQLPFDVQRWKKAAAIKKSVWQRFPDKPS